MIRGIMIQGGTEDIFSAIKNIIQYQNKWNDRLNKQPGDRIAKKMSTQDVRKQGGHNKQADPSMFP